MEPAEAFDGRRRAFRGGVAAAFRMPVWVVSASMMGFGSLARDSGVSFGVAVVSTATVWGLPGQIAFVEAMTLRFAPGMPEQHRAPYYTGLSTTCMIVGVLSTGLGYYLAGTFPFYITVSLIFLNIMYFTFLFASVRQRNCLLALMIGAALGPLFHLISPEWGLPFCGVIAGTAAFFIDQRLGDGHG